MHQHQEKEELNIRIRVVYSKQKSHFYIKTISTLLVVRQPEPSRLSLVLLSTEPKLAQDSTSESAWLA